MDAGEFEALLEGSSLGVAWLARRLGEGPDDRWMSDVSCAGRVFRGTVYPVDHYAAASRAISVVSIVTARASGDVAEVAAEVLAEHGERGLMALVEAQALLVRMLVEDLSVVLDGAVGDVPARVCELFGVYGEERELVPFLPRLLEAAGGADLRAGAALARVVEESGVSPAWVVGLAKTAGMVLRLLEAGGEMDIDGLISVAEDRLLILA